MDFEAMAQLPPEFLAEYNGRPLLVAAYVTIFIVIIFTTLRVYGRVFILDKDRRRGLEWDDGKLSSRNARERNVVLTETCVNSGHDFGDVIFRAILRFHNIKSASTSSVV